VEAQGKASGFSKVSQGKIFNFSLKLQGWPDSTIIKIKSKREA
jgi:hypothetical protein